MDIRLIGPPDVIQAWAGMMRESYGVKTTLMRSRRGDDLRCYVHMDNELATIYSDSWSKCRDDIVDAAAPPSKDDA